MVYDILYIIMGWIMENYINVKIIGYGKTFIILKEKNKKIFEGYTNNYGKIKIPIINNNIYKLIIKMKNNILIVPIYAKKGYKYCIPINVYKKENDITVYLKDYNYPEILITKGEVNLWDEGILSI